jgi:hypothetical protein
MIPRNKLVIDTHNNFYRRIRSSRHCAVHTAAQRSIDYLITTDEYPEIVGA